MSRTVKHSAVAPDELDRVGTTLAEVTASLRSWASAGLRCGWDFLTGRTFPRDRADSYPRPIGRIVDRKELFHSELRPPLRQLRQQDGLPFSRLLSADTVLGRLRQRRRPTTRRIIFPSARYIRRTIPP